MLPATPPVQRSAAIMPSRLPQAGEASERTALRPAPSLQAIALVALSVAALAIGPLALVRPVPAGAEDLIRLTGLLAVLAVLGGAIALTRAGVVTRVLVSALLAGTAATAVHVAAYTVLGTAGRSPADFWSLGTAAVAGTVVAVWLGVTALAGQASSWGVLGALAAANTVAAAVLGAVFLGG
jgi:hypothetical protein